MPTSALNNLFQHYKAHAGLGCTHLQSTHVTPDLYFGWQRFLRVLYHFHVRHHLLTVSAPLPSPTPPPISYHPGTLVFRPVRTLRLHTLWPLVSPCLACATVPYWSSIHYMWPHLLPTRPFPIRLPKPRLLCPLLTFIVSNPWHSCPSLA